MRDPARVDTILEFLRHIWKKNPDLRLGQLILNCVKDSNEMQLHDDLYYLEDEELIKRMEKLYFRFPDE